jgi:hypothetical protein
MILHKTMSVIIAIVATLVLASSTLATNSPQNRDHLTPKEVDLVKDAQVLDQRIGVFVKAIERRLLALKLVAEIETKQSRKNAEKDAEAWGDLPTGSRAELISDIAKILDEAITNIDDVNARDEKNPLIAKSVRKLAAEAARVVDHLKPLQGQSTSEAEAGSLEQLFEDADAILQAANKLPAAATPSKTKSKDEKPKTNN